MSKALTVHNGAPLDLIQVSEHMTRSGFFKDAKGVSQAVVKILYGQEVGIGPVTSMMGIHIIEGKPAPSANLIASRIKASGRYDYRVREHSATECKIEFFQYENGGKESLGTVSWTMDDARRAGLGGRGPWKSYPRAMLFARAISEGARTHTPDLFGGAPVYTPEELGAEVNEEGEVIVSTVPEPKMPRKAKKEEEPIEIEAEVLVNDDDPRWAELELNAQQLGAKAETYLAGMKKQGATDKRMEEIKALLVMRLLESGLDWKEPEAETDAAA